MIGDDDKLYSTLLYSTQLDIQGIQFHKQLNLALTLIWVSGRLLTIGYQSNIGPYCTRTTAI